MALFYFFTHTTKTTMNNDYKQTARQPYPVGFICTMLFTFFLIHYSIWQREDDTRSSLPFTELQFFQDFLSHPLHCIDPVMSLFLVFILVWLHAVHFIESNPVLHISDEQISWSILGYHYKTVVKCRDIQQIQYIEIPPKDTKQTVLLRFKTPHSECDLQLNLFNEIAIQAILEQLSKYQASLQSNRISISKTI